VSDGTKLAIGWDTTRRKWSADFGKGRGGLDELCYARCEVTANPLEGVEPSHMVVVTRAEDRGRLARPSGNMPGRTSPVWV